MLMHIAEVKGHVQGSDVVEVQLNASLCLNRLNGDLSCDRHRVARNCNQGVCRKQLNSGQVIVCNHNAIAKAEGAALAHKVNASTLHHRAEHVVAVKLVRFMLFYLLWSKGILQ